MVTSALSLLYEQPLLVVWEGDPGLHPIVSRQAPSVVDEEVKEVVAVEEDEAEMRGIVAASVVIVVIEEKINGNVKEEIEILPVLHLVIEHDDHAHLLQQQHQLLLLVIEVGWQ